MAAITLTVPAMTCRLGVRVVTARLRDLRGVEVVQANARTAVLIVRGEVSEPRSVPCWSQRGRVRRLAPAFAASRDSDAAGSTAKARASPSAHGSLGNGRCTGGCGGRGQLVADHLDEPPVVRTVALQRPARAGAGGVDGDAALEIAGQPPAASTRACSGGASPRGTAGFLHIDTGDPSGVRGALQQRRELVGGMPMVGCECTFAVEDVGRRHSDRADGGRPRPDGAHDHRWRPPLDVDR